MHMRCVPTAPNLLRVARCITIAQALCEETHSMQTHMMLTAILQVRIS